MKTPREFADPFSWSRELEAATAARDAEFREACAAERNTLQSKLDEVRKLAEKWRSEATGSYPDPEAFAEELEGLLRGSS